MRRDLLKLRAGRAVALHLGLCLAFLLWPAVVRAQSVAFINPGKSDEIYWVTASQAMEAAAKSLGMNFEVQYAQREPLKTLEIARELAARPAGKRLIRRPASAGCGRRGTTCRPSSRRRRPS